MKVLIITGPTGTGKSDFALACAARISGEIINADAGQFYAPLVVGTAMPTSVPESIPHHLFGYLDKPLQSTVLDWHERVSDLIDQCRKRGKLPIVVGGSGFYISSLLYPIPLGPPRSNPSPRYEAISTEALYEELLRVDMQRAHEIHCNDRYRLIRALEIAATGAVPSELKPRFLPVFSSGLIVQIERGDAELKDRIAQRIAHMIDVGWLDEVEALNDSWREFALRRGFIGYRHIMAHLHEGQEKNYLSEIADETWKYVKKQRKYLRGLKRRLEKVDNSGIVWKEFCLTSENCEVYLNQIQSLYAS